MLLLAKVEFDLSVGHGNVRGILCPGVRKGKYFSDLSLY